MPGPLDILTAVLLGVALWVAGVHFFDLVHWVLHGMLRSRWRPLRLLATPHLMHHRWLDGSLTTRWEYQRANLWGHIVLEYSTQLAFSGLLLLLLPAAVVGVCAALQTLTFAYILGQRGLDINHRAIEMLDAYRPSVLAMPAYHALHHVYPDAYYSAYSKLIDYIVGGGTCLRRRVGFVGGDSAFGRELRGLLERAGARSLGELEAVASDARARLSGLDVLVICDPAADRLAAVEAFVGATRDRQLPPEVWAVQERVEDRLARHYYRDVRVSYRAIRVPAHVLADPDAARPAARRALFWIRRGLNYVPTQGTPGGLCDFLRFRGVDPQQPPDAVGVRHRADALQPA